MILRREDVARHPAHVGAELVERFDEHGRLNRHVQAAHDLRAGQRLLALVAGAQRHQAWHLLLGKPDLLPSELCLAEILDLVRLTSRLDRCVEWMHLSNCCAH